MKTKLPFLVVGAMLTAILPSLAQNAPTQTASNQTTPTSAVTQPADRDAKVARGPTKSAEHPETMYYKLRRADARVMARLINDLYATRTTAASATQDLKRGQTTFYFDPKQQPDKAALGEATTTMIIAVADPRTNSVILSASQPMQRQISSIVIERLDQDEQLPIDRQPHFTEVTAAQSNMPAVTVLQVPVNVKFQETPVVQAVTEITKASGVPIRLEMNSRSAENLALGIRLTVSATDVPLGRLLQEIGRQTHLMIAPDGKGILLKAWPTMNVDGAKQIFLGQNAPWSDEWAAWLTQNQQVQVPLIVMTPAGPLQILPAPGNQSIKIEQGNVPAARFVTGQGVTPPGNPGGPQPGAGGPATVDPVAQQPGQLGALPDGPTPVSPGGVGTGLAPQQFGGGPGQPMQGMPGYTYNPAYAYAAPGALSIMMTALSDHSFVIAEPGIGPRGEIGLYLSIYRLEGNQLKQISTVFHKSANNPRQLAPPPGGHGPDGRGSADPFGGGSVPPGTFNGFGRGKGGSDNGAAGPAGRANRNNKGDDTNGARPADPTINPKGGDPRQFPVLPPPTVLDGDDSKSEKPKPSANTPEEGGGKTPVPESREEKEKPSPSPAPTPPETPKPNAPVPDETAKR